MSGAGSAQQTTSYSLGDRYIYAVPLDNLHVYMVVDCELICPPQNANTSSLSRALSRRIGRDAAPSRNEWLVTLSAETFGAKDSVSLGASLVGRNGNKLQITKPPAAPGQSGFEMFLTDDGSRVPTSRNDAPRGVWA